MRTYFDCIPCFVRQALDAVRMITPDEAVHERLLQDVLRLLCGMDLRQSPPVMAQLIHRLVREVTGDDDPYREVKDRFNRLALDMYDEAKTWADRSADPLETVVRLTIAGNVIDMGVNSHLTNEQVHQAIMHALQAPLDGSVDVFRDAIAGAQSILYLADNAGEIVLDRLLIERMPLEKVTVAVRGMPIINDATMADAQVAGLTQLVTVIDNGSDAPGTILDDCSSAFRRRFDEADLVIAKGQGNYETLSDVDRDIFFILKAKCPVIARHLGCEVGSLILRKSSCATVGAEKGG